METSLADRVRRLLDASGLKAREASRLAGCSSEAHVGMLIRGDVADPRVSTVVPLARVFGCSVGYLFEGTGHAPTDEEVRAAVDRARAAQAHAATGTEG